MYRMLYTNKPKTMKTKKIPISLNENELKRIQELAELLGLGRIEEGYGVIPKTLKLSIELSLELLNIIDLFIPNLESDKLDLYFTSIKKLKERKQNTKTTEKR